MTRQPNRTELVEIGDDVLRVLVWPGKGADIVGVVDVAAGIDVLFTAPWPRRDPAAIPPLGSSEADWLARYPGGWQVLMPNAGPAREVGSVRRGYHGEAALLPWTVASRGPTQLTMNVELFTAPLQVERVLDVSDGALRVQERVVNLGRDAVDFTWVHHPVFGAPFVDGDCVIDASARTVVTDSDAPGTDLPAGRRGAFPQLSVDPGRTVDLSRVPPPHSRTARFAALTDFASDAWYSISSPSCGFGIRMTWDARVLPHAWFWQECHAGAGFPWFGRAYAIAIEPANVLPGGGVHPESFPAGGPGGGTRLAPSAEVTCELRCDRFSL